jgi:2-hydroxymuconate-semialdehyde hydrolase
MAYAEHGFDFEGMAVHYITAGRGFPILMLHGSGPGVSTVGNWRKVLDPLAERFKVYAMDLIGFGRSARKPAPPYFDIDLWLRQAKAMIGRMEGDKIGLVGHSVSGAMSLMLAASETRVAKVLTTGTMGARVAASDGTVKTWSFPRNRQELQAAAEVLIYDKSVIDEAYLANREAVLFSGDYGPYFTAMFAGDKQAFIDAAVIPEETLKKITCDVTMLHGRNDLAFPYEATMTIAQSLPQANVILIGRCSHSVAFEHPRMLVAAADALFPAKD